VSDKPKKEDLMSWINPEGNNFLGSGMSMREWLMAKSIVEFQQSWSNQEPRERKRRLHFNVLMVQEMTRIQREYGQEVEGTWYVASGAFMESAIEAVMAGSKEDLKRAAEMYEPKAFEWNYGERGEWEVWAERYAPFLKICMDCHDSWPTGEEPIQA